MVGWQRQAESSELADGFARRHRQGLRKAYGLAAATRRLQPGPDRAATQDVAGVEGRTVSTRVNAELQNGSSTEDAIALDDSPAS